MEFKYAYELKKIFSVSGHFYKLRLSNSILNCRSTLEITRKNKSSELPEIIVIMMNPGSSKPLDRNYEPRTFTKKEYLQIKTADIVPAQPDNAQYQIMRLMELNNWNYVRILNLSDLRNGNSGKFQIEFRKALELDENNPHCITHFDRKDELINCIESKSNKIIAAWGDLAELEESAKKVLELDYEIIGLRKTNTSNFRYASPYLKRQKLEWLTEIQKEIIKN